MSLPRLSFVSLLPAFLLACSTKGTAASADADVPDAAVAIEAGTADAAPEANADAGCPGTKGPLSIRVTGSSESFCIDATEVTRAQYAEFLASNPTSATQTADCQWHGNFVPSQDWPAAAGTEAFPVVWVDYCDAAGFCAWAGKRLCGDIGGGDGRPAAAGAGSQWLLACSHDGSKNFPYGGMYDPSACNSANDGGPVAVGTKSGCEGGYPGIFDMSGNVQEWRAACTPDSGAGVAQADICLLGGGSFSTPNTNQSCATTYTGSRVGKFADLGFRCCGP